MATGRNIPGRVGRPTRRLRLWARHYFLPICYYCHRRIDWTLDPQRDRMAGTMAHRIPVSIRPDLAVSRDNIMGVAHRACNSEAGNRDDTQSTAQRDVTNRSRQW